MYLCDSNAKGRSHPTRVATALVVPSLKVSQCHASASLTFLPDLNHPQKVLMRYAEPAMQGAHRCHRVARKKSLRRMFLPKVHASSGRMGQAESILTAPMVAKGSAEAKLQSAEPMSSKESKQSDLPEVAIVGRSNVGKSSLVNLLTWRKRLAGTSTTPGKTQKIQRYKMVPVKGKDWALVDLPGYGFAKVPNRVSNQCAALLELSSISSDCCISASSSHPMALPSASLWTRASHKLRLACFGCFVAMPCDLKYLFCCITSPLAATVLDLLLPSQGQPSKASWCMRAYPPF